MKNIPLLLLLITATATLTKAQEFGGNPPSIKWKQINTPAAKVIFPVGLDSAGRVVANIVQQMNAVIQPTIGFKQKQISIVLQNQTTIANAYVGLAPFRSEFFLTPEQNSFDIGSLPWTSQLAIHEFRHVQQYNNFDVGVSHLMKVIFGEGGQALANGLAIPDWFFEGDAVYNETLVSEQGRGRLPYFLAGYRALWAAGKEYSWMKLRNGSYWDYTPSWYPTGYMLVSYGREKYGDDFWKKVTHDAAAYKGGFYPLQRAIKKYSGKSFVEFRNDAFNFYKQQFEGDEKSQSNESIKGHFVADLEYPAYVNDSTLIYMKSTYNHLPAFIIKKGNKEKKVAVRDFALDNYFAYHDGKIIYSAYRPDLRWNYRNYSELTLLDLKTGKERRLTKNSKYFAPDFSPDGKTIVAVKEGTDGKCDVHLLNASNGQLLLVIPNKNNLFFTYPKFYGEGRIVTAVRNDVGKMSLALINIKTGEAKYLVPFSYQPIVFPVVKNDTVYFSATSGIDDRLFALSLKTNRLFELKNFNKNGPIGNYEPALSDTKFAWVGLTAVGYQVTEANKKDLQWEPLTANALPGALPDFGIAGLTRDASTDLLDKIKNDSLPVTKYKKSHHLVNFHSLIPAFSDPNYTLSLAGENVLNTLQTDLSFTYNRNEGYKDLGFETAYGALFPYISAGAEYIISRRGFYKGDNIYWNETDVRGGLELPLNFTRGTHSTYLQIGSDIYYSQTAFQQNYGAGLNNTSYAYSNNYIRFSNSIQQARQNIYPRLAQTVSLNFKSAISGITADQFLASGYFYFPGFLVNHNLVFNLAHQQKDRNEAIDFSNDFPFSRGYQAENFYKMDKAGVNYHFPIAYPDAGLANTIYFLRVRGNAFYDYTNVSDYYTNNHPFKGTFRSTGAEVYFDTQWFNQSAITFGFRYSYLIDQDTFGPPGRNRFEVIVPITVF